MEGGNLQHTMTAGVADPSTSCQAGIESLDIISFFSKIHQEEERSKE